MESDYPLGSHTEDLTCTRVWFFYLVAFLLRAGRVLFPAAHDCGDLGISVVNGCVTRVSDGGGTLVGI